LPWESHLELPESEQLEWKSFCQASALGNNFTKESAPPI
jgi:hypothetical protein